MILNPVFNPVHIETEKKVVLEEISMYEDDPEEYAHDLLTEEMWIDGPLGYPILGTAKSLQNITRKDLYEYMCDFYVPDNCVISVVGNFKESKLLTIINKYFSKWKSIGYCRLQEKRPDFRTHFLYRKKDTEQTLSLIHISPLCKYGMVCCSPVNTEKLMESIEILKNAFIEYEFRTTYTPELNDDDLMDILSLIHIFHQIFCPADYVGLFLFC